MRELLYLLFLSDEKGIFGDEDEKITGLENVDEIAFALNNDILYEVHVEIGGLSEAFCEQTVKKILRYYGNDYRYVEEYDNYIWEDGTSNISLRILSDEDESKFALFLVISDTKYNS